MITREQYLEYKKRVEEWEDKNIEVYPLERAKLLFRKLRMMGMRVDLGENTGNVYSKDGRKLTWMVKDRLDNWIIEKLY